MNLLLTEMGYFLWVEEGSVVFVIDSVNTEHGTEEAMLKSSLLFREIPVWRVIKNKTWRVLHSVFCPLWTSILFPPPLFGFKIKTKFFKAKFLVLCQALSVLGGSQSEYIFFSLLQEAAVVLKHFKIVSCNHRSVVQWEQRVGVPLAFLLQTVDLNFYMNWNEWMLSVFKEN